MVVQTPVPPTPFAEAALAAATGLRDAIDAALRSLPASPRRAQEVVDALDLDFNLAWKLVNVVNEADVFAGAREAPGAAGMDIFARALERAGAPAGGVERFRAAARAFTDLAVTHAGDRAALDSMLGDLAGRRNQRTDLAHRRAGFKASSAIFGAQAQLEAVTFVLSPTGSSSVGPGPAGYDVLRLRGIVGLQRLRHDIAWIVARGRWTDLDGHGQSHRRLPLDPQAAAQASGMPVLGRHCSSPRPQFRRFQDATGTTVDQLVEGPVGKTAAMTFFTGELMHPLPAPPRPGHSVGSLRLAARAGTPCELLVMDILLHRSIRPDGGPDYLLVSELGVPDLHATPPSGLLRVPQCEAVEERGAGRGVLRLVDFPEYPSIVDECVRAVGWRTEEFRAFRLALRFPPVPTAAIVSWRSSTVAEPERGPEATLGGAGGWH
jgi:hypothetical protein